MISSLASDKTSSGTLYLCQNVSLSCTGRGFAFSPGNVCFCFTIQVFHKWVNESWKFRITYGWKDNEALHLSPHSKFALSTLQVKRISLSLVNKQCRGWKSQLGCLELL